MGSIESEAVEFFDTEFYLSQLDTEPSDPYGHYLAVGDAAGLDPNPYFSTWFYKASYPDWSSRGELTALDDWLGRIGDGEERRCHPMIDPDEYALMYPDVAPLRSQRTVHFIRHGDREGRQPSALFDPTFYRSTYLGTAETRPFRHFVMTGQRAGNQARQSQRSAVWTAAEVRRVCAGLDRPIVVACHDARQAGVPILSLDVARALIERGWDPVFAVLEGGALLAEFRDLGPTFVIAEGWSADGFAAGVPTGTPAVVHSAAAVRLAQTLAFHSHPTLLAIHEMADYLDDVALVEPLRGAVELGAELIVSNPATAQRLRPALGEMPVLRPGIRLAPVALSRFRAVARRLAGPGPVCIGAGFADERKGFDLFLDAAARLSILRPDAKFVWLGELGAAASELADAAIDRGLDLELPGFVDDAIAWYRAADVYLLTSRQDAGPTTVVHSLAMGTPFVAYGADLGILELIEPLGTVVPPGDALAFVDAVLDEIDRDDRSARRRRRAVVADEGSFDVYVDSLLSRLPSELPTAP